MTGRQDPRAGRQGIGWLRAAARILAHRADAARDGRVVISPQLARLLAAHLRAELEGLRRAAA